MCLPQMLKNIFTDTAEVSVNIQVGIAKNGKTQALQVGVPTSIIVLLVRIAVLGPIQFYHQFMGGNVKIDDIRVKNLLPSHGLRQRLEKVEPQMTFLPRHRMAHFAGMKE